MSRTRVLILISGLAIGESLGGAERYGVDLARSLDQEAFEPILCAFWRYHTPAEAHWLERLRDSGVECMFAVDRGQGFTPARYLSGVHNILAQLAGRRPDIIHSHFQLGSVTTPILKRHFDTRATVRTAHGSVRHEWRDTVLGSVCRAVFTECVFPISFDAETGVSNKVVTSLDRRLCSRLWHRRAWMIPNAIDRSQFEQRDTEALARRSLGLSEDDLVVGSVGRLSEQKGYRYLIEAAPTILEAFPHCRFLLVGDGELREELRRQADRLGVASAFHFAGAHQETALAYAAMDLFVLPSLWEGLPTVLLEAMASGIPVVATDISGNRDLVTDGVTGRLAQPRNGQDLARVITDALANAEFSYSLARQAALEVVTRYDIQTVARQYEHLYATLLASTPLAS